MERIKRKFGVDLEMHTPRVPNRETVQDVVGNHPGIEFHPRPTDDPMVRRPDTAKAERILGWKAQISLNVTTCAG